jgi:osmotically-inducible protein OsmY
MKHLVILSLLAFSTSSSSLAHARPEPSLAATADHPSDAEITANVVAAIQADDTLRYYAGDVQVSTSGGLVTLTGNVPRDAIRMRMAQVARAASDSSRVVNLVKVVPNS